MSTSNTSTNSNQQTLADSGANERPLMLENGNYIPWESRFRRFLVNKLEDGERMWNSIQNGPYQRPMVVDPTNPTVPILEPLSKMTESNKKQYIVDVRVMNYLLQAIPNDIYNSGDACKNAKEMWERIKRLMHGSEITTNVRHLRLMDEFDKFAAKEGESLDSVHERLTTLENIMDRNNVVQFEPHVLASRAKKATKNHDPLALIAHSNASSSHSYQMVELTYKPRMQIMVEMLTTMQGETELKGLMQVMKAIRLFNAFHELSLLQAKQMFSVIIAMRKDIMLNDFMLDTSYGEDLEELPAAVMLMARLQPANENVETVPSYDVKAVSQVHDSSKVHEQVCHGKRKTIIQTTDDDQIDSNIIFDDPFVENNGGASEHDSTVHDEYSGLGYTNPVRLKKAIAAQPKMYVGDLLHNNKLGIHTIDSEETLEDAEEKLFAEQAYFLIPSTSDNGSTYKDVPSESSVPKMPTESRLLTTIDTLGDTIIGFQTWINKTFLQDTERRWLSDSQNELREFYKTDVISMSRSLYKTLKEIKEELIEEVQEMLNIFVSMEQQVNDKSPTENILENEIDRLLEASLTSEIRNCVLLSVEQQKHELLKVELEKSASDSRDIQANLLKRIKILENDFQRSQAQSIDFELKLQHQKEKMDCDVSWKAKLSTLHDENVLLKHQVESTVKERENIKLEFQKLFNSIKATRAQHQNEINEMFEDVTQKTYAYADVRAQNQDLLMTISELKSKLKTIDKGKHVNTKFDKSETLGQLLCVTPFNKNLAIKAKNVSNTKVTSDRSKPVTSQSTPTIEQKQQHNTNVIARGMYNINQEDTKTKDSKATQMFPIPQVIQLVLWIVDSGCSKHMTGNLQLLRNFVEKFIGIVRFWE
ncbi:hypothetical protein Tco_1362199 [Tanacetum coccineum]